MHQTKKGNMYFFDMKAHIGIDAENHAFCSVEPLDDSKAATSNGRGAS